MATLEKTRQSKPLSIFPNQKVTKTVTPEATMARRQAMLRFHAFRNGYMRWHQWVRPQDVEGWRVHCLTTDSPCITFWTLDGKFSGRLDLLDRAIQRGWFRVIQQQAEALVKIGRVVVGTRGVSIHGLKKTKRNEAMLLFFDIFESCRSYLTDKPFKPVE